MGLDIRYAGSGGVSIAYQVVGDGDVDLVYVPDYVSNLMDRGAAQLKGVPGDWRLYAAADG